MNPQCARCGKVVYPTEKVNCLDKVLGRGRAGTASSGRALPAPRSPRLRRGGQGRAGPPGKRVEPAGGKCSASGVPLRRHPRRHRRATGAVSPRWRRAGVSGGRGGPESPCGTRTGSDGAWE